MAQSDTTKQQASPKNEKAQRGSSGRILFVLFLGLCVLIWFAPLIVSRTSLKNSILPRILKHYPGEISTGEVSLGWTQPAIFQNVALQDFEGRDIARIRQIKTQKTLWDLALDRKHVGEIDIEGVTSLTYVDDQGIANRDLLTAILNKGTKEHPEGEPGQEGSTSSGSQQSMKLRLTDLDLIVVKPDSEEVPYLTGMQVTVTKPELRTEPVLVEGNWEQPSAENEDLKNPAEIAFIVSFVNAGEADQSRSGSLKFKTRFFDLNHLTPLVSALSPGAKINGISNSNLQVKWSGTKEEPRFAVKGDWEAAPLQFSAPEWIGDDEIDTEYAKGNIDALAANGVLHFKDAHAHSQLGNLTLKGSLNWADLQNESKREKLAGFLNSRMKFSGNLDLAEAARQLPQTIHLKPGMEITSGTIDFEISNHDPDQAEKTAETIWMVGLKTSDLTGRNQGREIRWEQPMSLLMQIAKEPESYEIQSLRCQSDFLKLSGTGNGNHLAINLEANLDQLSRHLDQFFDLQAVSLQGKMNGEIGFEIKDQAWETRSYLNFDNLQMALPDRRDWREPNLKLTVEGAGKNDPEQIHVDRFIVTLIAAEDAFQAKLEQPTTINRNREASIEEQLLPFKIQLKGKLASWADRVRPLSKQDLQLGGEVQFASSVSISDQYIVHEDTNINLTDARIYTPTLWIDEPRAAITTSGSWNRLQRTLKASLFSYRSTTINVNGKELEVQLPNAEIKTPSFMGSLAFNGNLHQISQWFQNPAEPAAQKYYGALTGQANVVVTEEARLANWRTTIADFAIEAPVKENSNPQKKVVFSQRNPGWAISWQEPEVRIEGDTLQDLKSDTLTLNQMSVQSEMLDLAAKGEIREFSTRKQVRLTGEVTYDWQNLTPLLRSKLGPDVDIVGRETRPFTLNGPLGSSESDQLQNVSFNVRPRPLLPDTRPLFTPTDQYNDLRGEAGIGWDKANIRGLTSGKTNIEARIENGQIRFSPLNMQVSGGQFTLAPVIRLDVKPAALVLERGAVIQNFQFTPEMTRNSLRFVAPMLANSTSIQGQFSLNQDFAIIPINNPSEGEARGTFIVKSARVRPGPLLDELSEKITQILAIVKLNRPGGILAPDSVLVQVDNQVVQYHMVEGRVYHSPFEVQMKGVTVKTTGSVGLDESLDLIAEVGFTNLLREDSGKPVLKSLLGRPLRLPIKGTLKKPKIDMRQVGNYAKQMGVNALDAVLGSGFGQQLQGLFPERTPEEMERIQKEREARKKERDKRRELKRLERLKRKQGL
ncbi:hypothetical protein [Gimesia aquarii]|uniref:Putative assembly protein n=1 Tax=Gimesia aquarii TaxID=2527964 RepID=A0A517WN87_9PLAN|nr:hypothetical protein [Gimesia aquarii]QDU06727.1 putative assembly protein [Gimesia aquarii]